MKNSPKRPASDYALTAVKAALSRAPYGGVLATLLDLIPTTWQKRQEESLAQLQADFKRLQQRINDERVRSENFHMIMIKIIRDAIIEPHKEKQEAFRALLLNEAIASSPNEEIDLFIKITGDLTHEHILALKILADPEDAQRQYPAVGQYIRSVTSPNPGRIMPGDIASVFLGPALQDIPADHWPVVLEDLTRSGLIINPGMTAGGGSGWAAPMRPQEISKKKTAPLGSRYIEFITLPY